MGPGCLNGSSAEASLPAKVIRLKGPGSPTPQRPAGPGGRLSRARLPARLPPRHPLRRRQGRLARVARGVGGATYRPTTRATIFRPRRVIRIERKEARGRQALSECPRFWPITPLSCGFLTYLPDVDHFSAVHAALLAVVWCNPRPRTNGRGTRKHHRVPTCGADDRAGLTQPGSACGQCPPLRATYPVSTR